MTARLRLLGLIFLMLLSAPASQAQTANRPNVLVHFLIRDVKPYNIRAVAAPGEIVSQTDVGEVGSYDLSPDGQWMVQIDRVALDPVHLEGPLDTGLFDDVQTTWIRSAQFSLDGHYLLYKGFLLSSPERGPDGYYQTVPDELLVGALELATQRRVEMVLQASRFGDLYSFEFFHFDGQTLFAHRPNSFEFYAFDLSGLDTADSPQPAPPAESLFGEPSLPLPSPEPGTVPHETTLDGFQVSPDGTKLALLMRETDENTLVVTDLSSRQVLFSYSLDQAIQSMTWELDGTEILLADRDSVTLHTLNVTAHTITPGLTLPLEGVARIEAMLACDQTLYFVGISVDGFPALYSAPLSHLSDPSGPLNPDAEAGIEAIHLLKCME